MLLAIFLPFLKNSAWWLHLELMQRIYIPFNNNQHLLNMRFRLIKSWYKNKYLSMPIMLPNRTFTLNLRKLRFTSCKMSINNIKNVWKNMKIKLRLPNVILSMINLIKQYKLLTITMEGHYPLVDCLSYLCLIYKENNEHMLMLHRPFMH